MNDREITIEEENDVLKTADRLCELIKSSAEFNEYRDALEALKADDNLYKQVEEIRKNNFFAHNGSYGKMSYDEYCNVYNATRMIRQNKLAGSFLDAELDFARMMQKINGKITDTVNLDFDFM